MELQSFPFIVSVGLAAKAIAMLHQLKCMHLNTLANEMLKKAFEICPYPTPLFKVLLPKTLNFTMDRLTNWFKRERAKIQAEIQVKKGESTKNIV